MRLCVCVCVCVQVPFLLSSRKRAQLGAGIKFFARLLFALLSHADLDFRSPRAVSLTANKEGKRGICKHGSKHGHTHTHTRTQWTLPEGDALESIHKKLARAGLDVLRADGPHQTAICKKREKLSFPFQIAGDTRNTRCEAPDCPIRCLLLTLIQHLRQLPPSGGAPIKCIVILTTRVAFEILKLLFSSFHLFIIHFSHSLGFVNYHHHYYYH